MTDLTTEELEAIYMVLQDKTSSALRLGEGSIEEEKAAALVEAVLVKADPLIEGITLYTQYRLPPDEDLSEGGVLIDPAFLSGGTKDPGQTAGAVTIAVEVPAGSKALAFPGAYVLGQGLMMVLEPSKPGTTIAAKLAEDVLGE